MMNFQVLGVAGLVSERFELHRIVTAKEAHVVIAIALRCGKDTRKGLSVSVQRKIVLSYEQRNEQPEYSNRWEG